MPKKVDVLQVLADVLNAMFAGEKVVVETTGVKFLDFYKRFEKDPQILTPQGAKRHGQEKSDNVLTAKSIKVGQDITVKRNSKNFIVRTANGELLLPNKPNSDIGCIWAALGSIYDNGEKCIMHIAGNLSRQLPTKELRDIAKNVAEHGMVQKQKQSKYVAAIKQMRELGVRSTRRIMEYIEKQRKENA